MDKKSNSNFSSGALPNSDPEYIKEVLSALADDELAADDSLTDAELVELACKDHNTRTAWQCIHITRDVLQADYHSALDTDFAQRLSAKIEREEAPHQSTVALIGSTRESTRDTAKYNSRNKVARHRPRTPEAPLTIWKPVAGLGLAASLAGAVFLAPQLWKSETSDQQLVDNTVNQSQPVSGVQTVAFLGANARQIGNTGTRWRSDTQLPRNQQVEQRLNALLTNHLEDASMGRVHGMLAHSRVVSYDSMPSNSEGF